MNNEDKKNILLVEDEFLIAMTEKLELEKYGYIVKTVNNGEKAIEAVKTTFDIDLILMDINLGDGIDGTEAAAIILKNHNIPIVFVSSHSEREVVEKTEKVTSYGYVVKNSSITVLDASIKMAFKLFDEKMATRKKEELLHENEEKYRRLHENAGIGIGYYSLEGIVLSYNQLAAKHMGGVPEDFIGKSIFDIFPKSDANEYLNRIQKAASSETLDVYEDIVPLPTGNMYFLSTFTKIIGIENQLLGIQIISQDITDRKNTEEALRESKQKAEMLLNVAAEIIISLDSQGNITLLNESGHRILGYESPELVGKNWFDACLPIEDREEVKKYFGLLLKGETDSLVIHESDVITNEGERKTILWHNSILKDKDGKGIGLFSSGENISDRKKDQKLNETLSARIKLAMDAANIAWWEMDIHTGSVAFDRKKTDMLGYKAENFRNYKDFMSLVHPEDIEKTMNAMQNHFSGVSDKYETEYRILSNSGIYKYFYDIGSINVRDNTGKPIKVVGMVIDITERKQAEELLRLDKERFDLAIENSGAGVWDWDMINDKVVFSDRWRQMLGYTEKEIENSFIGWKNLWHPDDAIQIEMAIDDYINGKTKTYEVIHRCLHKDGEWRWILTRGDIVKDIHGKSIRWVGTNLDISDLKNSQMKIGILLAEKETILKEVHHRIKNNMNAMKDLLSLQAGRMNDKTAIYALEDASNRMESMTVLYDQLYQSSGFTELSINTYISPLADAIISNFSGSSSVKIEKRIDDIILDAKRLQPIGIIINELLTNIMKHAFIENSKGIINLSATLEKGHVIIVVQDNGIGMPMSINFGNSTGFGLTLVHALAEQIDADILIERDGGTRFILEFIL